MCVCVGGRGERGGGKYEGMCVEVSACSEHLFTQSILLHWQLKPGTLGSILATLFH